MPNKALEPAAFDAPRAARPVLIRTELEFHRLLESLPAGAYTCDADGLITDFNQHAVRIWGRAPELRDPIDRFCGSFKLHAKDGSPLPHDQCWMALALKDDREYLGEEIVIERADGQRVTALAHASPFHDEDGKLLGAINVLVDITDRKRAEQALARSEEALREEDRRKDEFLATLAHELRNPLAPILSSLQLLRVGEPVNPASRRAVDVIERQIHQLVRLVDDLMEVSRITRGKIDLKKERVSLSAVVQGAVERSKPLIDAAGHKLEVTLPDEEITLDADPVRLTQVFANILDNAAKYTDGPGHVWLTARRDGSHVAVSVCDQGIGIPGERLPEIFEMFSQVDSTFARTRGGGLGIGLTLVRSLVQMHGGMVEARSDGPGTGSVFIVRLPIASEERHAAARFEERDGPLARTCILAVDDNRDAADSLGTLLEFVGADAKVAYDGKGALEAIRKYRPAIVLLDIGMPGLDGYEVARRVRADPDLDGVKLIALTGWGQSEDRRRSKDAGFDHHLVKPVDLAALQALLVSLTRKD